MSIWTQTNCKIWDLNRGKQIDFFQFFVPLRLDGTKIYHIHILLSVSSLDSKLNFGNPYTYEIKNIWKENFLLVIFW